jgi:hypothetical protein
MPHHRDRRRIARSKFKLSLVLGELNEPDARDLKSEAHRIRMEERLESNSYSEDEGAYDALVAYITSPILLLLEPYLDGPVNHLPYMYMRCALHGHSRIGLS